MKHVLENKIFLSFENSFNLFSLSISNGNIFFYNEIFKSDIEFEYILRLINNFLLKKRIFFSKIDAVVLGRGFASFTDLRILFSVSHSLSLGWKIPVFVVPSMHAIALEAFSIHNVESVFIASLLKDDVFCYKFYNKNNFFLEKCFYNIDKISNMSFPDGNTYGIINCPTNFIKHFHKANPNLSIKNFIYPKSIYLDFFIRKKAIYSKIDNVVHTMPDYVFDISYRKYEI